MSVVMLVLAIISTIAVVVSTYITVWQWLEKRKIMTTKGVEPEKLHEMKAKTDRRFRISSAFMVVFAGLATLSLWILLTRPPHDPSRYAFESGTMGWTYERYADSQGCIAVEQSADRAKYGKYSLKLSVELEGGHENRTKGEAYVEIAPQNLENKPISVWVYVPREALGNPEHWNGIQVFVKDAHKDWRAEYGTWWNITPARVDAWHQVTLTPSRTQPPDGYMVPGFDPTQVRSVGVKAAINDKSTATYRGPIYIDVIDWPQ